MNELETLGLKAKLKELLEEELDSSTTIEELKEDIRELQGKVFGNTEDEPEETDDLPEEEQVEDNPAREKYEQKVEQVKNQVSDGGRVNKETMNKIQTPPSRKIVNRSQKDINEFEDEFNGTEEETEEDL